MGRTYVCGGKSATVADLKLGGVPTPRPALDPGRDLVRTPSARARRNLERSREISIRDKPVNRRLAQSDALADLRKFQKLDRRVLHREPPLFMNGRGNYSGKLSTARPARAI